MSSAGREYERFALFQLLDLDRWLIVQLPVQLMTILSFNPI